MAHKTRPPYKEGIKLSIQNLCLEGRDIQVINLVKVDGEDQSDIRISLKEIPLDQAQEEAIHLVEWALTQIGHCEPTEA